MSSRSSVVGSLDGFADFCRDPLRLENGQPMRLEPFQRLMLEPYFAGVRESLILVSKKNGKSSLLAALALYHLLLVEDAECVIAAASRDQAQILLGQAHGLVRRSSLRDVFHVKQREIVDRAGGGRIRVLAADADTADGVIPSLALVDELHRHRTAELYGVFRDGLQPRNGSILTISTAGDDERSPLGRIRTKMHREELVPKPALADDWAYRQFRSRDGQFVMHEWALPGDADVADMAVVKRANPASWHTEASLWERYSSPSTTPWQWARFACGIWMPGEEESVFTADEWAACYTDVPPPDDVEWIAGLDLGWKWDTTALVPVGVRGDELWVSNPEVLEPPGEGVALDADEILEACDRFQRRTGGRTIVLDPNFGGEQLGQTLEGRGFDVVTHPQDPSPMSDASARLYEAVRSRRLRHDGYQPLTNHILASCRKVTSGEKWRLVKPRRKKLPIDGAIALALALAVAEQPAPTSEPMVAFL